MLRGMSPCTTRFAFFQYVTLTARPAQSRHLHSSRSTTITASAMPQHQNRHRRKHKVNRGYDEDQKASQEDYSYSSQSHSQSRNPNSSSSHHTDTYRGSISTRRGSYDAGREPSSSRTAQEDSWRMDQKEDSYAVDYHNGSHRANDRDDYDMAGTRESEGWGSRRSRDAHYPPRSRDEWTSSQYGDSREPYPPYQEKSNWEPPPTSAYDDRTQHLRWPTEDVQQRRHDNGYGNRAAKREVHTQDKERSSDWGVSDMGWVPRPREPGRRNWESEDTGDQLEATTPPLPDRSWEPAPGWHNTRKNEHSAHERPFSNSNGHNKPHKSKKNQHAKSRNKSQDDGHLNKYVEINLKNLNCALTADVPSSNSAGTGARVLTELQSQAPLERSIHGLARVHALPLNPSIPTIPEVVVVRVRCLPRPNAQHTAQMR